MADALRLPSRTKTRDAAAPPKTKAALEAGGGGGDAAKTHIKAFGYMSLLSDGIHNFLDGIAIGNVVE